MKQNSTHHFGLALAVVLGLVTAVAATIAVAAKSKTSGLDTLDFSDNWDEVLGI